MRREIEVRPCQREDISELLAKADGVYHDLKTKESPGTESWREEESGWLEPLMVHGGELFPVVSLVACENGQVVGWVHGQEQKNETGDFHHIEVRMLHSFGDPVACRRLVSGVLDYARAHGARSISFSLNDPEEVEEAELAKTGMQLVSHSTHRIYQISLR